MQKGRTAARGKAEAFRDMRLGTKELRGGFGWYRKDKLHRGSPRCSVARWTPEEDQVRGDLPPEGGGVFGWRPDEKRAD